MTMQMRQLMWGVAVLLIAAALGTRGLNMDAYSYDELRSLVVVGAAQYGPLSYPGGVLARLIEQSPDQAWGFAMVLRPWGELVGWSEAATRVMPLLAGLLCIAVTYRAGSEMLHPMAGRTAALVLAVSIFYVTYLHKLRVFTLAALAVSVALWCYWRIMLSGKKAGWLFYAGLLVAGIGLFYTHYFTTPFFAVIGLYHLTAGPKDRRWWITTEVALIVIALFFPAIPTVIEGFDHNQAKDTVQAAALGPVGAVGLLARYFGNGSGWASVALLGLAVWAVFAPPENTRRRTGFFLLWCAIGMLVAILAMNAAAGVLAPWRVRYLMPLWVPLALLGGLGVWKAWTHARYTAVILVAAWVVGGVFATLDDTLMTFDQGEQTAQPPWREFTGIVFEQGEPGEPFVYLGERFGYQHGHYTHGLENRPMVPPYEGEPELEAAVGEALRVWVGMHEVETPPEHAAAMHDVLETRGYVRCETAFEGGPFTLVLWGASEVFCPGAAALDVDFGGLLALEAVAAKQEGDTLTVDMGWALRMGFPPYTYSVSVQAEGTDGEMINAADVGFGAADGPYTPMRVRLDLPQDTDYELFVVVYDWQTGERLSPSSGAADGRYVLSSASPPLR